MMSFDPCNESGTLQQAIEKYKKRTGYYPEIVLEDKIYRTGENILFRKERESRLAGPAPGRPKKVISPAIRFKIILTIVTE